MNNVADPIYIDFENLEPEINGMTANEAVDYAYLEIGDVRKLQIDNQLLKPEWDENSKTPELLVSLCCNPDYLHFVAKYVLNIELLPFQCVILQTLWTKPLVCFITTRGGGKSYILAVYLILRMLLDQGSVVCVVGAGLRQSMIIFNYLVNIWEDAPVLRDIANNEPPKRDTHMCHWRLGKSRASFLPLGDGSKIRGQRATVIIADEFASIPIDVFDTVVRGFAAVKSIGVHQNVKKAYTKKIIKMLKKKASESSADDDYEDAKSLHDNQIIVSGTAYYRFNHFYRYYSYYKAIITSGGNKELLQKEFPEKRTDADIDASKYAIIRIPYDAIPDGMMDATILSQARATMDPNIFDMEYGACFPADSEGFYLASWLQKSTCPVKLSDGALVDFGPRLIGIKERLYVMGIDPASEDDRFAITIMEHNNNYRALVYQWSINRKEFEELKRDPMHPIKDSIKDYNTFIVTHIRDLVRRFHVSLIIMDSAGGGVSVTESLKDPTKLLDEYDELLFNMEDENVQGLKGRHILKLVQFSDTTWRVDAHYTLRKDLMDKKIIFPKYDPAEMQLQSYMDTQVGKNFDKLEDVYLEIEQCKNETALIQHEETPTGQERWDVPKVAGIDAEQVRKMLKKDRFTSLLLANWGFKYMEENSYIPEAGVFGGVVNQLKGQDIAGAPFIGKGAAKFKRMPELNLNPHRVLECQSDKNRKIFY